MDLRELIRRLEEFADQEGSDGETNGSLPVYFANNEQDDLIFYSIERVEDDIVIDVRVGEG